MAEGEDMDDGRCFTQETVGGWLVVTSVKPRSIFTLSDIEELYSLDTPSGRPGARLLFIDETTGASKEVRDYFKIAKHRPGLACVAIVTQSPVANILANYFIRLSQTSYSRKLFDSEDKAVQWIKAMMENTVAKIA